MFDFELFAFLEKAIPTFENRRSTAEVAGKGVMSNDMAGGPANVVMVI